MAVLKDKVFPCCFDKGDHQKNPSSRILNLLFYKSLREKRKGVAPLSSKWERSYSSPIFSLWVTQKWLLRGNVVQGAYLPWGVESNYTLVELLLNSRSDDSHSELAEMKEENSLWKWHFLLNVIFKPPCILKYTTLSQCEFWRILKDSSGKRGLHCFFVKRTTQMR